MTVARDNRVKELPIIGKLQIVKTVKPPDNPGFWTI